MDGIDVPTLLRVAGGRWAGRGPPPRFRVTGVSTDSRAVRPGDVFFGLPGLRHEGHEFVDHALARGAALCVVSRPHARRHPGRPVVEAGDALDALEALARWARRRLTASITAITGSVGKTTTKDFLGAVLGTRWRTVVAPRSFNNRLGVALTLLAADTRTEHLVVELGASAPGEIERLVRAVRPDRAVVTSIAPAHLSGLRDLDGVVAAKGEILLGLPPGAPAWLRAGTPGFERLAARAPGPVGSFGVEEGDVAVRGVRPSVDPADGRPGQDFEIDGRRLRLPVLGRHNAVNAAAAVAVARQLGLGWDAIEQGLLACRLPPRRLELGVEGGVWLLDDSYNANPASLAAALDAWRELPGHAGRSVAVLGDMLELGPASRVLHEEAGRRLAAMPCDLLVTVGGASAGLGEAFAACRSASGTPSGEVRHFERAGAARDWLAARLRPGDRVLVKGSNVSGVGDVAMGLRRLLGRGKTNAGREATG